MFTIYDKYVIPQLYLSGYYYSTWGEFFKSLKGIVKAHFPAEIEKIRLAYFHVISPNATKYTTELDKRFYRAKKNSRQ